MARGMAKNENVEHQFIGFDKSKNSENDMKKFEMIDTQNKKNDNCNQFDNKISITNNSGMLLANPESPPLSTSFPLSKISFYSLTQESNSNSNRNDDIEFDRDFATNERVFDLRRHNNLLKRKSTSTSKSKNNFKASRKVTYRPPTPATGLKRKNKWFSASILSMADDDGVGM